MCDEAHDRSPARARLRSRFTHSCSCCSSGRRRRQRDAAHHAGREELPRPCEPGVAAAAPAPCRSRRSTGWLVSFSLRRSCQRELALDVEQRHGELGEVVHALGADRQLAGERGRVDGERERGGAVGRLVRRSAARSPASLRPGPCSGRAAGRACAAGVCSARNAWIHASAVSREASHAARCAAAITAGSTAWPQRRCGRLHSSTLRNVVDVARPATMVAATRLRASSRARRGEMRMLAPFSALTTVVT